MSPRSGSGPSQLQSMHVAQGMPLPPAPTAPAPQSYKRKNLDALAVSCDDLLQEATATLSQRPPTQHLLQQQQHQQQFMFPQQQQQQAPNRSRIPDTNGRSKSLKLYCEPGRKINQQTFTKKRPNKRAKQDSVPGETMLLEEPWGMAFPDAAPSTFNSMPRGGMGVQMGGLGAQMSGPSGQMGGPGAQMHRPGFQMRGPAPHMMGPGQGAQMVGAVPGAQMVGAAPGAQMMAAAPGTQMVGQIQGQVPEHQHRQQSYVLSGLVSLVTALKGRLSGNQWEHFAACVQHESRTNNHQGAAEDTQLVHVLTGVVEAWV